MRKIGSKAALAAMAAFALAACDGGGAGTGSGASRLTIRLTDAPGDLAQAWVKVENVYLQGTSAADSTSGRVELPLASTGYVDLLTLAGGGFRTLVGDATVPAGTYSQLRFVVCDAYVVTDDGRVFATKDAELPAGVAATGELKIPSGCSSGFKVKLPNGGVKLESDATVMVVDFDVSQSFGHEAGKSGKWVMKPVMTATEVGFAGGISGTVALAQGVTLPACGGAATDLTAFVPRAVAGADSVSGTTQAGGAYAMGAVQPGTYTLTYASPISYTNGDTLTFTAAATPASVTVASGATATANYQVTAASCKVKTAGAQ